jgi:2,4-dienoyl-CoA reductase-like NADH-dependent reductase (Old Yellow Enzyme family)
MAARPLLFTLTELRGVKLKRRIVISPMCNYSPTDGYINDWQQLRLGEFSQVAAGLAFPEAADAQKDAPITRDELGNWSNE